MKRKIEIYDILVSNRVVIKTDIEIKQLNMYEQLENCVSYYVIENLIFIPL